MVIEETSKGIVADAYVKPRSKKFQIKCEYEELIVFCKETPVKGKVNRELIKELSKFFKSRARILSGFTSRYKKLLIENVDLEELNHLLNQH